ILLLCILSVVIFYFTLQDKQLTAKELYNEGENYVLDENYLKAKEVFIDALSYKDNFYEANIALNFVEKVINIESELDEALKLQENQKFQEALTMINSAEKTLKTYHGTAVNNLIDQIIIQKNNTKIE